MHTHTHHTLIIITPELRLKTNQSTGQNRNASKSTKNMQSSCGIVDDIEDILKQDDFTDLTAEDLNRSGKRSFILPKALRKAKPALCPGADELQLLDESSNAPGLASIYVKTWGCTRNGSDCEYMAGQLAAYGYRLVGK